MTDRKYRQRGYQDQPREARVPPRERQDVAERGPRGRGLGAPTASVFRCAGCGRKRELLGPIEIGATCPDCQAALHACAACSHFDSSAPRECRQEVPVRVARKSAANDCALFAPKQTREFAEESPAKPSADDPRSAFDALFKR